MLLRSYEDETVRRVAAGAIANLAMNGKLITDQWLRQQKHGVVCVGYNADDFFYIICLWGNRSEPTTDCGPRRN